MNLDATSRAVTVRNYLLYTNFYFRVQVMEPTMFGYSLAFCFSRISTSFVLHVYRSSKWLNSLPFVLLRIIWLFQWLFISPKYYLAMHKHRLNLDVLLGRKVGYNLSLYARMSTLCLTRGVNYYFYHNYVSPQRRETGKGSLHVYRWLQNFFWQCFANIYISCGNLNDVWRANKILIFNASTTRTCFKS